MRVPINRESISQHPLHYFKLSSFESYKLSSAYHSAYDVAVSCNFIWCSFTLLGSSLIIDSAKKEARQESSKIRERANANLEKSENTLAEATVRANSIIANAEEKAVEIAGTAYAAKKEEDTLRRTILALRNTIEGYKDDYLIPTYTLLDQLAEDFGYTEAGEELKRARQITRIMVKNQQAAKCDYVENNRRTTAISFTTDAFNGKVDTILTTVKQDNYGTLKQKITDAFVLVNNLGQAFRNAVITDEYLKSRLEELKWAVIVTELRNIEREEQRVIKERIREEEKAKREFEKALRDAEKEEELIKKTLAKAKADLESASESQKAEFEKKLNDLEEKLRIAEEKGQRALSMAQQTQSGHVYVISNLGSFGENVYKIGMTRRLEPMDRVKELGDASVPFPFDVHAMIYSKNAPALEKQLHNKFVTQKLNKVNTRKEFFDVTIKSIREYIEAEGLNTTWTMASTAAEYRESLAINKNIDDSETTKSEWIRQAE